MLRSYGVLPSVVLVKAKEYFLLNTIGDETYLLTLYASYASKYLYILCTTAFNTFAAKCVATEAVSVTKVIHKAI